MERGDVLFYPQNIIEDIRTCVDIVDVISSYVKLDPSGSNYFGLCPFHNEKSPSFSVSRSKQIYHCFGCGASGNVFTFLMQMDRLDFIESVQNIAQRINYTLPESSAGYDFSVETKKQLYEIHKKVARYYYDLLQGHIGEKAKQYLDNRQVSQAMIRKFGLGFSGNANNEVYKLLLGEGYDLDLILKSGLVIKGNNGTYFDRFSGRLMFPIFDVSNRVIGFGGRIMESENKGGKVQAKYLNSPETPIFDKSKNLYGLNFAKNSKSKHLILVEGYMDVISLVQYGYENVVASLGTAFNENHVRNIRKFTSNVSLLFDSDEAGIKATIRAIPFLVENGINVKVVKLDGYKDPDEFLKANGGELFQKHLDISDSYIDFLIKNEQNKYNLDNVSEKVEFTLKVANILAKLNNEVEKDAYIKSVGQMTNISVEAIASDINKLNNNKKEGQVIKKVYSDISTEKKGVIDAKKSLITILLKNKGISDKLEQCLQPKEMTNKTYERLLVLIYGFHKANKIVCEADIITFFQELDEQKTVSNIFNTSIEFEDDEKMERVINDLVRTIKTDYLDKMTSGLTEAEDLQEIINKKKLVNKLHINLTKG